MIPESVVNIQFHLVGKGPQITPNIKIKNDRTRI